MCEQRRAAAGGTELARAEAREDAPRLLHALFGRVEDADDQDRYQREPRRRVAAVVPAQEPQQWRYADTGEHWHGGSARRSEQRTDVLIGTILAHSTCQSASAPAPDDALGTYDKPK